MFENRITDLFKIKYPIIQAGMIWCSGWELASAVSNAGGLGIIGSGSMYPEILEQHVKKCKSATNKPFAVNLPLIYPDIDKHIQTIIKHKVPIVFSSAGNPKTYTPILKDHGITVVHVVPGTRYAIKSQEAGVDAVVGEGFEAGGHNGREETTTLCLIPNMVENLDIPVIAAGGIATGKAMLAMFALGAEGVQMGSRFVASLESSAHIHFKQKVVETHEGETQLALKKLTPVRLIKNEFFQKAQAAEKEGASKEELKNLLGRGRAKSGMFEGKLDSGELEIGQVAALINDLKPAGQIVEEIWKEFTDALSAMKQLNT
jgi:enoyl-[acyl-carrier protein] reductase II